MGNDKIILKLICVEDSKFINMVANNNELMDIFCDENSSLEEWQEAIKIWNEDEDEEDYIIEDANEHKYIGWVGVNGLLGEHKTAWIKMIAILPEYWAQGYGSMVIKELKNNLFKKNYTKIRLWTDKCNKRAQKCYINNGFTIVDKKILSVGSLNVTRERLLMECAI